MVSDFIPSPMTQVAIEAALKAGAILRAGYGTQYEISFKPGVQNYVTEYDYASERCLIEYIKKYYPSH